ncbi:MAG TPA: carboxypeptidase regulatory-like domain-containing protein [Streptosporangiaceae bacterium]|jgi:subtilase family serine protease/N-acetylneuraminic acid mutarotase
MSVSREKLTSLAIAPVTLLAMILLPAGGAQASATGPGHAHQAAIPKQSARVAVASPGQPPEADSSDVRQVCSTPKRGYAACMSLLRTNVAARKGVFTHDAAPAGYGPSDLQSAYNLPSASAGSGETVAIVDAGDDPTAGADLATYRTQYGLAACTTASGCFEKVNQEGQQGDYPPADGDWPVEESLDVDMVSAVCPSCHILLVEANSAANSDLFAAEDEAVTLGAKYVSNSWAEPEQDLGSAAAEAQADASFNHPGTVIAAAGGDNGFDNYQEGADSPNYPASSQYVTSVGGTTLTRDSGAARGWAETTWSPDPSATGSGCSLYEPKPAWQTDSGCANRMTNDVSAVADPNNGSGVAVYDTTGEGGWIVLGGTSVATPIIASTYALAGSPQAGTYPSSYPYLNATGLNDVTSGTNYDASCAPAYFCTAEPGYDGPTGLGTPDGVSAFEPVGAGRITGTVTAAATGKAVAGATVTIGSSSVTTGSTGTYSLAVAPGTYTVTTRAFGYAEKTISGVQVAQGQTTTQNVALATAADVTVSGTVTDGSGQAWPLFAKISISGDPHTTYTDPFTGDYSISVPGQTSYTMTVTPAYPGYTTDTVAVQVGTTDLRQNADVTVNVSTCDAPGYASSAGKCAPVSGGLVAGVVTDANTGKPVNGATITGAASQSGASEKTSDPMLRNGFYWLFASPPGPTTLTAFGAGYQAATASATVASGTVTQQDWSLKAGELAITPAGVSAAEALGQSVAQKVTLTNNGSEPVQVSLGTQAGTFTPAGQSAARPDASSVPFQMTKGHFAASSIAGSQLPRAAAGLAASSSRSDWSTIADYPIPIAFAAAATDPQTGDVYSVDGVTNSGYTSKGYVYSPSAGNWSPIASAPVSVQNPAAAFVDGTLYLAGGWDANASPSAAVYAYTPGSNSWAKMASLPAGVAGATAAVLGGQLYIVGGCTDGSCDQVSDAVYRYDPGSNAWSQVANYPVPVSFGACAGLDGQVVCTGGSNTTDNDLSSTYLYDPVTSTWTRGADMPSVRGSGYWGMSYAGANGALQIAGGVTNGSTQVTNEAQAYDPVTNTWSLLPSSNYASYESAGACGFYQIGGGGSEGEGSQLLAGYDQCDGAGDTPWLSVKSTAITVPAGQSVTVKAQLDAAKVDQPGTYTAVLWAATNTPYPVQAIPVTLQVNPPAGWQEITGTVTGPGGMPVAGATVTVGQPAGGKEVTATQSNGDGAWQWWLPAGRVQVSAAKDYYQPQARLVNLRSAKSATVSFDLKADPVGSKSGDVPATSRGSHSASGATPTAAKARKKGTVTYVRACSTPQPGDAACLALVRTNVPRHKGLFTADTTPVGYGPSDLRNAYALPSGSAGSGATVAVVDAYDDPSAASDLATYRKQYGLPACTTADGCFEKVNQEGQQGHYPAADASWALEESLDIDMVSAICPSCHILLVEGNSASIASLGKSVDEAVKLGAKYVSNSYGLSEAAQETQYDKDYDHPGVAITAGAGDTGYGVSFPAASPDVTSVGGTTLTRDSGTARGWTETVWGSSQPGTVEGTGSGCSAYEPKPAWQRDTGCKNRTDNDVAAVADPSTPVAVYDSGDGGWLEFGGTSVATPIIASTYALAGTPAAGTYPDSYPYLHATGLNDITAGANGTCKLAYLCTGEPGYDGPTGLGTPDGTAAFTPVTYGTLTGIVTSAATGQPVAGAAVTADGLTATTGSTGSYSLTVPPGSWPVTATYYGYATSSTRGVKVTAGQTASANFTLTRTAKVTVSGTVTDGSGHGWPLYAKITVAGVPGVPAAPAYTSPFTGKYSIRLPGQNSYTLTVTPDTPGYATTPVTVDVGTSALRHDITVPVVLLACLQAPGYKFSTTGGIYQQFTGWSGGTPRSGWSDIDNNNSGELWQFNGQRGLSDLPGGSGGYAVATGSAGQTVNTSLISPAFDLTGSSSPAISFNMGAYIYTGTFDASVALSLDGGKTWQRVWQQTTVPEDESGSVVNIPVPQAANEPDVEVRFTLVAAPTYIGYWAIGSVLVGDPGCAPVAGGLVAGTVTDANTGQPVNGATVASDTKPVQSTVTAATGDPALPGGYYWLFSRPGAAKFTVTDGRYVPASGSVDMAPNTVTQQNWTLKAGQLNADATSLSATETLGQSGTTKVTFRNAGAATVHVAFGTQAGMFTPLTQASQRSVGASAHDAMAGSATGVGTATAAAGPKWAKITHLPAAVVNNAVAYDPQTGTLYSVGGSSDGLPGQGIGGCSYGTTNRTYAYDSSARAWTSIAPLPQPLESPAAAFLDGTLYVAGGFDCNDDPSSAVYAYTPGAGTWAQVASLPATGGAGVAMAVLDGELYAVGGCTAWSCGSESQSVSRYDPATGGWTKLASYPVYGGVAFGACAGVDGEIVCAGGLGGGEVPLSSTFRYNPGSNTWVTGAGMLYSDYQMAYAGSGGQLQIAGGVGGPTAEGTALSQVSQYNPASNTWSSLPGLKSAVWGGGGSCGMYVVGGSSSANGADELKSVEVLPGYNRCDGAGDTGWLSAPRGFALKPGQSVVVDVTFDAAQVDQPGTYTADLWAATSTPYPVTVIPVTLTVKPPSGWGLLSGTVTDASGKPIAGATVQVDTTCTSGDHCGRLSYTLATAVDGSYQWWLPASDNGLQVIAANDGYIQQVTQADVGAGKTLTLNYALQNYRPSMR